jgi:hypothetical protein
MRWEVELRARGTFYVEVEAATEEEAVRLAWEELHASEPGAEWDVEEVEPMDTDATSVL